MVGYNYAVLPTAITFSTASNLLAAQAGKDVFGANDLILLMSFSLILSYGQNKVHGGMW